MFTRHLGSFSSVLSLALSLALPVVTTVATPALANRVSADKDNLAVTSKREAEGAEAAKRAEADARKVREARYLRSVVHGQFAALHGAAFLIAPTVTNAVVAASVKPDSPFMKWYFERDWKIASLETAIHNQQNHEITVLGRRPQFGRVSPLVGEFKKQLRNVKKGSGLPLRVRALNRIGVPAVQVLLALNFAADVYNAASGEQLPAGPGEIFFPAVYQGRRIFKTYQETPVSEKSSLTGLNGQAGPSAQSGTAGH
jgi:hypothetical protein